MTGAVLGRKLFIELMIFREAETVVHRSKGRAGLGSALGVLLVGSVGLLCLGCFPEEFPPQPVPKIDPRRELLHPVKIKVHPSSTVVRKSSGDDFEGLVIACETQDRFGDPVKAMGILRFEAYSYALSQPANKGPRVGYWPDIHLDSLETIQKHWDSVWGLYRFNLKWQQQAKPNQRFIVEATLTTPEGQQLADRQTIQASP